MWKLINLLTAYAVKMSNYLGWVPDHQSLDDYCWYDLRVELFYDREAEFGVRCVGFRRWCCNQSTACETEYKEMSDPLPFRYRLEDIQVAPGAEEMLKAACEAWTSRTEGLALMRAEEQLDEQSICKNETFYHRAKGIPGYPVLV